MLELRAYSDASGRTPFFEWLDLLDQPALRKVRRALEQIALGNTSEMQGVGAGAFGRLQTSSIGNLMSKKSPPSVPFAPYWRARIRREPALRDGMLQEAVQALVDNEVAVAKGLIHDVIKSTIGYQELTRRTGTPSPSLARMFGPKGNPTAANLFNVLAQLRAKNRVRFEVRMLGRSMTRRTQRPRSAPRRAA